MNKKIQIARILKPHGVKGTVKISPLVDIPFSKYPIVYVGEDNELMHLKHVQPLNGFYLFQLDEITSCEQAEFYRNKCIFADRDMYPELNDIITFNDYIGCEVFNELNERVGIVVDVDNYGSADVISINCNGTTYMVPFVEDTIHFDKEKGIFVIDSKRFLEIRV